MDREKIDGRGKKGYEREEGAGEEKRTRVEEGRRNIVMGGKQETETRIRSRKRRGN
jgi:hypothetical protein